MKAEHRKELETNELADRMGRMLQGAKKGSRSSFYWFLAALAVVVLVFLYSRYRTKQTEQAAFNWFLLEDGSGEAYDRLRESAGKSNAAKAMRFQMAWQRLWGDGIKRLHQFKNAKDSIEAAEADYKKLAEESRGDPTFLAEALYGLAVVEETKAIDNIDNLTIAVNKYKEVVKANKDSAFAERAKARLAVLEDEDKLRDLKKFYLDLAHYIKPRVEDLPFNHPPLSPDALKALIGKKDEKSDPAPEKNEKK